MTWKEFVAAVEKAGVNPDDKLWFIDLNTDLFGSNNGIFVQRHPEDGSVAISDD